MSGRWEIGDLEALACVSRLAPRGPSLSAEPNVLMGRVVSIRHGMTRTNVHVKVDQDVIVRSRRRTDGETWPTANVDEWVYVRIPEEAVFIGTAELPPGRPRWNHWMGRIVLVGPIAEGSRVTVIIKGEPITLHSANPVLGLHRRPQTWDCVTVAVDPERVELCRVEKTNGFESSQIQMGGVLCLRDHHWGDRVWLKGAIQSVRRLPDACIAELKIGDAHLTAYVEQNPAFDGLWEPGLAIELHMSQWEAWIKPAGNVLGVVPCRLTY